jgi:acetyl-CoA carboxylase alpha subunit
VSAPTPLLDALRIAVAFEPLGERAGNLTLGRGELDGRQLRLAVVENRAASGALGGVECERMGALFRIAAREKSPVVLFLDSAGAKVSEGLRALGAFRALYRAGLEAAFAGAPIAALLGRNCYGGASMLAHLAARRLFSPQTQLAMSGPAILASSAGMDPLDEMFRAMAEAAMSPASRAKASADNTVWEPGADVRDFLRAGLQPVDFAARHAKLLQRLPDDAKKPVALEAVQRRDLEKIYPGGYRAEESSGFLAGEGQGAHGTEAFIGVVGKSPLGVDRAWRFADAAWRHAKAAPPRLRVFLDCASHATRLEDERVVLSEYVADMAAALQAAALAGCRVETTILGKAGGGVYVALAAPAKPVSAVHDAHIQVLPGAALAAILGEGHDVAPPAAEYLAAGVAEEELRLGLV